MMRCYCDTTGGAEIPTRVPRKKIGVILGKRCWTIPVSQNGCSHRLWTLL